MIRALVVDDEALARRGLELRLAAFDDIEIVAQCRNGREALAAVRELSPDLLFLDVQMPAMSGFDVLRNLSAPVMPAVIFVTAYDKFALQAFEANALDYLLKPINDERLAEALERVRRSLAERDADSHRDKLLRLVCSLTGREMSLDAALDAAAATAVPIRSGWQFATVRRRVASTSRRSTGSMRPAITCVYMRTARRTSCAAR